MKNLLVKGKGREALPILTAYKITRTLMIPQIAALVLSYKKEVRHVNKVPFVQLTAAPL
jgi:hypothetical protein